MNKEGTGARAFAGAEYVSAGKTGTAQVYSLKGGKYEHGKVQERLRDHALFIAYAPAEQPTIACRIKATLAGLSGRLRRGCGSIGVRSPVLMFSTYLTRCGR